MPLSYEKETPSPTLEFLRGPNAQFFVTLSPEQKLRWILALLQAPVAPRQESEKWIEGKVWLGDLFVLFYFSLLGPGALLYAREDKGAGTSQPLRAMGPPPPVEESVLLKWIRALQEAGELFLLQCHSLAYPKKKSKSKFLQDLYASFPASAWYQYEPPDRIQSTQDLYAGLPRTPLSDGIRYSLVRNGKLVHVYDTADPVSSFLLLLGDLLTEVDLSRLMLCPRCLEFFYKNKGQRYCSRECTLKAHPSKERVRASRGRKAQWKQARERLELLLANAQQEPIEQTGKVMEAARTAFEKAFPRKTGHGYKEGKAFLTRAEKQIRFAPWEREREALKGALEKMHTLYQTTEKQALEETGDAYRRACTAFEPAFPNKNERSYEEGKEFLAYANDQIRRLRKKVKGY